MPQIQSPKTAGLLTTRQDVTFFASSYIISAILFSAVELGIFDLLERAPLSSRDVAQRLSLSPSATSRLLRCCEALALLRRDVDGFYSNKSLASEALVSVSPTTIIPEILHHARHVYRPFARLTEAIRTGAPQLRREPAPSDDISFDLYSAIGSDESEFTIFLRAMNSFSSGIGTWICETVDLSRRHCIADVGCGGGQVARELLSCLPRAKMLLLDLPVALSVAKRLIDEHGSADRVTYIPIEFSHGIPDSVNGSDVILLSAILGDWDEGARLDLLRETTRCLADDGLVLISETLQSSEKTNSLAASMLALYVLVITSGGSNFPESYWRQTLSSIGLSDIDVWRHPHGGRDLIVARKRSKPSASEKATVRTVALESRQRQEGRQRT
jgi:hypothetical protein